MNGLDQTRTLAKGVEGRLATWIADRSRGCRSVLDLGCGYGQYTRLVEDAHRIGVEAFEPYVKHGEAANIGGPEDMTFVCCDMRDYDPQRKFDLVMLIDSPEHLSKHDGAIMLMRAKAWTNRIIVFTPDGLHDQGECDGNPRQAHECGWSVEDFSRLGFSARVSADFHEPGYGAIFAEWNR